ncbi:MAG: Wzz/FepE/Etk N-terminal domain-containing protein [Chloroflexi bacterium]|nr:Wzz/FepE/Etk N-terminal domain-containing protein [Chloroflexota bacterium]MCL5076407.1 Wzz/FepE/Etk N-terminal domain-containing protein [Chloroflexota bacterium]
MEFEIDLREYLKPLIKHIRFIGMTMLVCALIATLVSFLLPPIYTGTATIVITKPRYRLQFDPRFQTVVETAPYETYYALLRNPDLEKRVLQQLGPIVPGLRPGELMAKIHLKQKDDPWVLEVSADWSEPRAAAKIANTWVINYVKQINELFALSPETEANLSNQLAKAEQDLKVAEDNLRNFQEKTGVGLLGPSGPVIAGESIPYASPERMGVIGRRLEAKIATLATYQSIRDDLHTVLERARELKAKGLDTDGSGMTLEVLQTGLISSRVQLLIGPGFEKKSSLDTIIATLEAKEKATDESIAAVAKEVADLQKQLSDLKIQLDRLERTRDSARETYLTLVRKADETRIAASATNTEVQIVSPAEVPIAPSGPRKVQNIAFGALFGLLVGVLGTYALEYFARPQKVLHPAQRLPAEIE